MKTRIIMLILVLGNWGAFAQHDHPKQTDEKKMDQSMAIFKDANFGKAYEHYIHLKDALVASDQDEARKAANELQKSLTGINNGKIVADEVAKVVAATSLKDQRKAFSTVSDTMATLIKGDQLSMGSIYLEYCPMANSNKGVYWLSNEKEIRNPYFGDKMLKCGSVKETIH